MPVNFNMLNSNPPQQANIIMPQSKMQSPSSDRGINDMIGATKGLLSKTFGQNIVSQTNQQVTQQSQAQQAAQQQQAIGQQQALAQQKMQQFSPASIQQVANQIFPNQPVLSQLATAQAMQESGIANGQPSKLASRYNNLYGMKGTGTAGSVQLPTTEYINGQPHKVMANFAAYKAPADSIAAYKQTLQNPRYANVLKAQSFEDATNEIQKAGYATDPNYAKQLRSIYNPANQTDNVYRSVSASANPNATPYSIAQSFLGVNAKGNTQTLENFFKKSGGQTVDPVNTPWCAAFANSVLGASGLKGTGSLAAKSFLGYGTPTTKPTQGDIVVFNDLTNSNNPNKGHVGFYAGIETKKGVQYIKTLGGNQDGSVSIKSYPASKVAGYREPPNFNRTHQNANQSQQNDFQAPTQQEDNVYPGWENSTNEGGNTAVTGVRD